MFLIGGWFTPSVGGYGWVLYLWLVYLLRLLVCLLGVCCFMICSDIGLFGWFVRLYIVLFLD